ncbi:hypothetical protein [Mucilaginibacter sp. SJ]|uniref:hypothetical protein n=1 Tax=Mucilaginibacter sp. SJ TaxID=3029053 RepID=UPI0023A9D768|nr:hypothetical protein [Mucilaginibacter sp. SJ]WDZ98912.1 hypothetical protein MusilaSJ_15685 [Mucilaginibacter sp. SJ]
MPAVDLSGVKQITPAAAPEVQEVAGITSVSLVGVTKDTPQPPPPGKPLSGIEQAGLDLAKIAFGIIFTFIVFLIIFFFVKELDATGALKGLSSSKDEKLIATIIAEKKAYRDFVLETSKTILLNLLLPILTAILGYIFGSSKEVRS